MANTTTDQTVQFRDPGAPEATRSSQRRTALSLALATTGSSWRRLAMPGALAALLGSGLASSPAHAFGSFQTYENGNMCINNPYESPWNGNWIVVNQHCTTEYFRPGAPWDGGGVGSLWRWLYDTHELVTDKYSLCMDNFYGVQSNGNSIVTWACNGGPTQKWNWDGATFHYDANPSKCVNIQWNSDGGEGKLVLWDCNGQLNQKFHYFE
jgi:hypothetical protein